MRVYESCMRVERGSVRVERGSMRVVERGISQIFFESQETGPNKTRWDMTKPNGKQI